MGSSFCLVIIVRGRNVLHDVFGGVVVRVLVWAAAGFVDDKDCVLDGEVVFVDDVVSRETRVVVAAKSSGSSGGHESPGDASPRSCKDGF